MKRLSDEVNNIILNAAKMTKNVNYDGWPDKLLYLIQMYPNINIIYDENLENSYYLPREHTIYLNATSSTVFLHELTHMFHHLESNYYVPESFEQLINISCKEPLIADFANSLNEHKRSIIKSKSSALDKKNYNLNLNNYNKINYLFLTNMNMDNDMIEINLDELMQDILDALVKGKGFDQGITYIKDNNFLAKKSGKICGHGVDYYKRPNSIYKEILANYATLTLIAPNYEYFAGLKLILGTPLVELLDKEVSKYFPSNIEKVENNNNIKK